MPSTCTVSVPAFKPRMLKAPVSAVTALPTMAPALSSACTVMPASGPFVPLIIPVTMPTPTPSAASDDTWIAATVEARVNATIRLMTAPQEAEKC